jgi:hypothetical protein
MKMKRGLVFTLCALALAASGRVAHAQLGALDVKLSLNLRYTDPFNPAEGGVWSLVAQTGSTKGIAGISAYLSNISGVATVNKYGNGVLSTAGSGYAGAFDATAIGAILNGGNPYVTTIGAAINVLYGQDTAAGAGGPGGNTIVLNVGRGVGTPNNIASDPLKNSTWNNSALIAQGTFTGTRPAFVNSGANSTDANVLPLTATATPPANTSLDAATTFFVRGDSFRGLNLEDAGGVKGLRQGDANRDFTVTGADFAILQNNFNQAPGTKGWDQADFNNDGNVSGADFALMQNNFNQPATPPITSIPEPASIVTLAIACFGLAAARSRRVRA